jgi:uncharacterized protein (DUF4415 family)
MMTEEDPMKLDKDDAPELTDELMARLRPASEVVSPTLLAAIKRSRGRPKGSTSSTKEQVALRLDVDVLEHFRAGGPGWQTRINEALRRVAEGAK